MALGADSKSLIEHLRYARQRTNILALLGLAALLAWWALPSARATDDPIGAAYDHYREVAGTRDALRVANEVASWIRTAPFEDLDKEARSVRESTSSIESAGLSDPELGYFGVSESRDRLIGIKGRLAARALPGDLGSWSRQEFEDVEYALSAPIDEPNDELIARIRRTLAEASRSPAAEAAAKQALADLQKFQRDARKVREAPRPKDDRLADDFASLAGQMEELGFLGTGPIRLGGEAREAAKDLQRGSLSVLGFSIPGLALRLLVPVLALALAIDAAIAAARMARFARMTLPQATAKEVIVGFPWLFAPVPAPDRGRLRRWSWRLGPPLVLTLPVLAVAPLVLSGSGWAKAFGLALLFATIAVQLRALSSLQALVRSSYPNPPEATDAGLGMDLAREHLNGAGKALTFELAACAAILAFFLVLALVPSSLKGDHRPLADAQSTREQFEKAYRQRLLDQPDSYARWCQIACDAWTDLAFAEMEMPAEHPAAALVSQIAHHPVARAESEASSWTKDLVLESRSHVAQMDRFDLDRVREILERDSFDDIVQLLGELRRANAANPIPQAVLERLPDGIAGPAGATASVPFAMPYRTWVERGGFADRLAPLPPPIRLDQWMQVMDLHQIDRVEGFDRLAAAIAAFDAEVGKVRLKIAGIEVSRAAASDASFVVLILLSGLLLFRLVQAANFLDQNGEIGDAALRSTPGILLTGPDAFRSANWLVDVLLFLPPIVTGWVVLAASAKTPTWSLIAFAIITATAIAGAVSRRTMVTPLGRQAPPASA